MTTSDEAAARELKALDLRRAGATFEHIARACGYRNRGSAFKAYQRALAKVTPETPEESRLLELARLDRLYSTFYPKALKGDLGAAAMCLKLSQRRSLLLGLDVTGTAAPAAPTGSDPLDELAKRRDARRAEA